MKKSLAMITIFILITGSAPAADWNFYGSARISTFHTGYEKDPFNGGTDTKNYEENLNGNACIGTNIKGIIGISKLPGDSAPLILSMQGKIIP
ncbi:MAG: hypothetical protein GY710_14475 [Desulfobacteraceae bacterium]|nr:hypothetical protein [Desulfobacteraceae bacterium]